MLIGAELLAKVESMADATKGDLVRACGYVSTSKAGRERLEYTDFYLALLAAKGITLNDPDDDGGRELTYTAKVQSSGGVSVGKAYISQLALKPGDEVQIKVNANDLQLVPIPTTTLSTTGVVVTAPAAVPAAA
jgi:hypothetical protein